MPSVFAYKVFCRVIIARAEGALMNIVVSLPCTLYLCGALIVL